MLDDQFSEYVTIYGGRTTSAVSGKTSYLVMGQDPGQTKQKSAATKGVSILTEDQFYDLIRKKTVDAGLKPVEVQYEQSLIPLTGGEQSDILDVTEQKAEDEEKPFEQPVYFSPRVPQSLDTVLGNKSVINELLETLQHPRNEFALFVYGPSGVGKTLSVELILKEIGARVIRLDGSGVRTQKELSSKLHCLLSTSVLDFDVKNRQVVVLIDDAESVDQGGLPFLNKFLERVRGEGCRIPFIFITNDPTSTKLKTIKKKSVEFQFKRPQKNLIGPYLIGVLNAAGVKPDKPAVEIIASKVNGDIRRAMQILQFSVTSNKLDMQEVMRAQRLAFPSDFLDVAADVLNFTRTKAKSTSPYTDMVEQFFSDPLLIYSALIQNYQSLSGFDIDFCESASDLLSLADCQMHRMYSLGEWSSSRDAAVMSTLLVGFEQCRTGAHAEGFARCVFPSVISLNKFLRGYNANLHEIGFADSLLSHKDQAEYIEAALKVSQYSTDDQEVANIVGNFNEDFIQDIQQLPAFDFLTTDAKKKIKHLQGFRRLEQLTIKQAYQRNHDANIPEKEPKSEPKKTSKTTKKSSKGKIVKKEESDAFSLDEDDL